jgi:hypothetical protein
MFVNLDLTSVVVILFPGFWHCKDLKIFTETLAFTFPQCCLVCSGNVYRGGPPGRCRSKNSGGRYQVWTNVDTASPLGVLVAGPAAATTEAGDIDGRPPGGCCRDFR